MQTLSLFDLAETQETTNQVEEAPNFDLPGEIRIEKDLKDPDIDNEMLKDLERFDFSQKSLKEELEFLENYYSEWKISKDLQRINTIKYYLKN